MDRSNSVSSTASASSRHSAEPFAYQTRILERTSSASRHAAAPQKNGVLAAALTGGGSGRRWTPSHRVGTSIDSVRGKWEERARAETVLNTQSSPSRSSFSTDDAQSTAPSSPAAHELALDARPSPTRTRTYSSSVDYAGGAPEPSAPPLSKRYTMPAPIVASPLSPNSTGISVVSPEPLSFTSATPTNRIHFPMSRPSVASVRQGFDSSADPASSTDLSAELTGSPSRSRRSVDFDSIMKESRTTSSSTLSSREESPISRVEETSPKRLRPTSLYGTPHFSTLSKQDPLSSTSQDRFARPSSPDKFPRPSSPVKFPRLTTVDASSTDDLPRQTSLDHPPRRRFLPPSKQDPFAPSSPDKSTFSKPITLPRKNSVKDSPFLRPSTPPSGSSPSRTVPQISYRPPPASPSSFSNGSSSAMLPTPYRSSYMANKKADLYGDNLSVGRKLGRHLPRIASGDAYEEPEPKPAPDPKPPATPDKENQAPSQDKPPESNSRLSRLERREKRLREWQLELERKPPAPVSKPSYPDSLPEREALSTPHAAPAQVGEVVGVPGRKRLSRDVLAPAAPLGAPMPLPSARLGARYGLWADTQRHLLRAYEYLCHVGEAQQWIEGCLGEELGFGVVEMEESLRNGVVLAKLARAFLGEGVVRRIFEAPKLDYRQTDNINHFFHFIRHVGLPECFIFETTDLYNKKNIPKVIYCIHALSHLLARRGLAERIGNLLGQLQFSDDQLQRTEKGLKDAGVPMPNFGDISRELAKEINEEPEVEVETEEERRDRLLLENEDSITSLQSTLRGFLVRKEQATLHARMRLAERYIVRFQARCRGATARQRILEQRKQQEDLTPWALALQARARGFIARREWRERLARVRAVVMNIVKVQAQARGVMQRRRFARLKAALVKSKVSVLKLQAAARARLVKRSHQQMHKTLGQTRTMQGVVGVQAVARAVLVRRKVASRMRALKKVEGNVVLLQAHVRGVLVRRRVRAQLAKLDDAADVVVRIQAAARCYLARKRLLNLIRGLRRATSAIVVVQALARANLQRKKHRAMSKAFGEVKVIAAVGGLQALARAALVRNKHQQQTKKLEFLQPDVIGFQAVGRGALVRRDFLAWRDHLRTSHAEAAHLQALVRGLLERRKFTAKMRYYRENLEKVIKIQSLFRAKETREQYRQLTMGRNVNVSTIKNFVHLLDDSEADFEDEIEVERLRKRVVQSIRANQALETEVTELDVKIALVVQNVKSFEELIKTRRRHDSAAAHASRASILAAHGDPFAGQSSLDQGTKRKLELYQQLFYLLQTRGDYLGKLFHHLAKVDIPDKNRKLVERVVLTLFGYGQDRREEYLLLKLFQSSVKSEIAIAPSAVLAMKEIPMFLSIALQYGRPKQVTYVRDTLQPLIWTVIEGVVNEEKLDLETDPCIVYRSRINIEEMRSGMKSNKPKDVDYRTAAEDYETRKVFIHNLQKLLALSKDFINAIVTSTKRMPYGMRFLARETLVALKAKFPDKTDEELTFKEVKAHAIYFLLELEKQGKVTREDGYQGILNAIAGDVRSKHRKRLQRQQELASMNEALHHLTERKKYYEEQIESYNNYVETAMKTMQKGKSKKRFVMPFTKQYFHLRDLQRTGRSPQFGSFKYSAQYLYDKGILLSIDQYSPRQFDRIDLVLASNKPGIFDIEMYNANSGPTVLVASTEIRMEDLLQAQFENRVSFPLFDGMAKFNLNLLLYQINKK
ncbi:hypothetical protein M0805_005653 [Coniferiporia weirii]|nr:hypothetical protein M0805_005653 [Coniferiporia weirii]